MTEGSGGLGNLKPLKITCTSTKCEDDQHCFKRSKKQKAGDPEQASRGGACRDCGADQIDWDRIYKNDLRDVSYTIFSLRQELIRNRFWSEDLSQKSMNYAIRKGKKGIRLAIRNRLLASVGKSPEHIYRDGMQTPTENIVNPIFAAQHATACCCRKCIEYWHNIPRDRELYADEIEYLAGLIEVFIEMKLPDLEEEGRKVSPLRGVTDGRA